MHHGRYTQLPKASLSMLTPSKMAARKEMGTSVPQTLNSDKHFNELEGGFSPRAF